MDLIKYMFEKPFVTSRIAQSQMLLTEYDIQYVTQKAIKASVLYDYLAHQPVEGYQPLRFNFLDEDILLSETMLCQAPEEGLEPGSRWTLVFDDASNALGHQIGTITISPSGSHLPFTTRLCFDCTNNMEEYEACIYGIKAAIDLRIKILEVYEDSIMVISQVKGDSETRDIKLIPYKEHIRKLIPYYNEISFHHIPREKNQLADTLAMLAPMFNVKWKNEAPAIYIDHLDEPTHCLEIDAYSYDNPWFYNIKTYIEKQTYPDGISITNKKAIRRLCSKFFLNGIVIYKRNYGYVLLSCEGVHAKGPAMDKKIHRAGYYWTTMEVNCYNFFIRCHMCQIYGDYATNFVECFNFSMGLLYMGY
ncbi:uncharacterized protein LOC127091525 [Lathyrus oleraceus]|uniref:uncharacterized protein LOC127091525 n=1 Tax=Pisum sativum TaxID=3888 RepID=UPI0021D2F7BF|nr:uncharacterized protein LOC127091525 [Pisum sativum]